MINDIPETIASPYAAGTMSFSGADYKAVIFLPLVKQDARIERRLDELLIQMTELRNNLSDIWWNDPSRNVTSELELLEAEYQSLSKFLSSGKPGALPIVLGDLQTCSISSHREKMPVRTLGRVYPHAYTRGPRTVAGSLIFTIMNKHALFDLVEAGLGVPNTGVKDLEGAYPDYSAVLVDQLPPFDLTIIGSNEAGDNSVATLHGVELINEGQTLSIEDLVTECVMQFVARDFEPLRPIGARVSLNTGEATLTATQVLKQAYNDQGRKKRRGDPFI